MTTAGDADPIFGKDVSFYLLSLPFYDDVLDIAIAILLLTIAVWFAGRLFMHRATVLIHSLSGGGALALQPQSNNAQAIWLRQGMILGALLCVAFAANRFLARYHLVADGHSKVLPAHPMSTSISGCRHMT